VGVPLVELDLVDESRVTPTIGKVTGAARRQLPTVVYLPAADGPAPLIVLAHGFNGHPRLFTTLAGHWAAGGYAVAVPRFPVSSDEFPTLDPQAFNERVADLPGQAEDVRFLVAALAVATDDPSSRLCGRVDIGRLGLYGLSLGALTVWSTVARRGFDEAGVAALIQSDGGFPGDLAQLADVRFPVLIAHSDVDPAFPVEGVLRQFDVLPAPRYLLVLHGAAHATVGENTPTPADQAYRVATTVFWDRYLGGATDAVFPESISVGGVTTFVDGS